MQEMVSTCGSGGCALRAGLVAGALTHRTKYAVSSRNVVGRKALADILSSYMI